MSTPRWVSVAARLHAASLLLYPRALREAHGEDMKQAFRDRCREAVAAGKGPFGLLLGEWVADTVRAVPEAHLAGPAFLSGPRQSLALALLCLSLIGLLSKDAMSGWLLDRGFALRNEWREYRYERDLGRLEAITRTQAAALAASEDPGRRAVAAYLFGSLGPERFATVEVIGQDYPAGFLDQNRGSLQDAERAKQLAAGIARNSDDAAALAIAALACDPHSLDCDRQAIVRKLLAVDAGNGFAWEMAFSEAMRSQDVGSQFQAIDAMARATRYDNYRGRMMKQLFTSAAEFDDGAGHMAGVAWAFRRAEYGTLQDWYDSAKFACTPRGDYDGAKPHWIDLHPDRIEACARIASLLSHSNDFRAAMWGSRRLAQAAATPGLRASAKARWRELAWMRMHVGGWPRHGMNESHSWNYSLAWKQQDWADWAAIGAAAEDEITAARRWMAVEGEPMQAPDWFLSEAN